jgi:hypothetical protein
VTSSTSPVTRCNALARACSGGARERRSPSPLGGPAHECGLSFFFRLEYWSLERSEGGRKPLRGDRAFSDRTKYFPVMASILVLRVGVIGV